MWLIYLIKAYLGWAISICRRIISLAAPQLGLVVIFTIVSQLARLLAFFLPVKIIILIGSDGVPRYFPRAFLEYEREPLVIWLGVATVGFYITYLIAEKVVEIFTEKSAERVLAHTAKLALFENQDEIVGNACRKLAESIAAVVFGTLAIALLAVIYPLVAGVIVGWVVAALIGTALAGMASARFRAWLDENAGDFIDTVSTLGFFIVTATIVAKFIAGFELPILFAIISVLLTRQLLRRIDKTFTNALGLYPKRFLINALFLRNHHLPTDRNPEQRRVWDLLTTNPPREWLPSLLLGATGEVAATAEMTRWHETGVLDIIAFDVKATGGSERDYLVKLFGSKRRLAALHEATLLGSLDPGALPAPTFLGSALAGDYHCHIFERPAGEPPAKAELKEVRLDLTADCWQCRPPGDLVERYRRSHQLLAQRLAGIDFERLKLAVTSPREEVGLASFSKRLKRLCETVGTVPLAILNPDLKSESMARLGDGRPVTLQWGRWQMEPVGAGWPTDDEVLEQLPLWLDKAREKRDDLAAVRPEDAQLVALLFEIDALVGRQRYRSAVELIPAVLKRTRKSAGRGLIP